MRWQRYVPLVCWIVTVVTLLCIPAKILSEGYLPVDDALRHAAKVVSGKPWSEILVMRPDFQMDPHPGWHAVLGAVHHTFNCNTETLVEIEVFGMMALVLLVVLPWFRRPEAWLGALLVLLLAAPVLIERLALGRPLLFTMAVSLVLLLLWSKAPTVPSLRYNIVTVALIAAAAWIHGGFYQLVLPALALLLCARWRQAAWFTVDWVIGSFVGSALTGHPLEFLSQSVRFLVAALGQHAFAHEIVMEFKPSDGSIIVVLTVAAVLIWRSRAPDWRASELLEPVFMMAVLGWVLGLSNGRFWYEWGLPATLLWVALKFQTQLELHLPPETITRAGVTCGVALSLYLVTTSDQSSRWTRNLTRDFLSLDNPKVAEWLPGRDGILYCADMDIFYSTFFKNPKAPWRYILGFEPSMMPPEDLLTWHQILWDANNPGTYGAWVKKMGANDRLVIPGSWLKGTEPPAIPELQWAHAGRNLWIGRRPLKKAEETAAPK